MVYAMQFGGDVDSLRTMWSAPAATNAMACLPESGHRPVIAHKESASRLTEIMALGGCRCVPFVDALVIVGEYAGDVDPVGAWHAVFASCAWH